MEGGWFSNCGSRLSAARIRLIKLQKFHRLRKIPFQNVALAFESRTYLKNCVSRIPMVNVPEMVRWQKSRLSECNSYVGSRH
eukprot:7550118-Pyramimonas_sp.AAC.1